MCDDFLHPQHTRMHMVAHDMLALFYCAQCMCVIHTPWQQGGWRAHVKTESKTATDTATATSTGVNMSTTHNDTVTDPTHDTDTGDDDPSPDAIVLTDTHITYPRHHLPGNIPTPACPQDTSHHVTRRTHITHSLSVAQLCDVYDMMRGVMHADMCVVDIGSRLGEWDVHFMAGHVGHDMM